MSSTLAPRQIGRITLPRARPWRGALSAPTPAGPASAEGRITTLEQQPGSPASVGPVLVPLAARRELDIALVVDAHRNRVLAQADLMALDPIRDGAPAERYHLVLTVSDALPLLKSQVLVLVEQDG